MAKRRIWRRRLKIKQGVKDKPFDPWQPEYPAKEPESMMYLNLSDTGKAAVLNISRVTGMSIAKILKPGNKEFKNV